MGISSLSKKHNKTTIHLSNGIVAEKSLRMSALSMKRIDVSVIIACYNEARLLVESVNAIVSVLSRSTYTFELIFVDDHSRDQTPGIIASMVKKHKNFRAVYHVVNQGRGKTVRDGIAIARGKVVGFVDIDLEVSPVYIPWFVNIIMKGNADVVTGLRIYREGIASLHRSVLSRGYSWLVRSVLGIPLRDTETGYKFFNRKNILPILKKTKNNGWFWDTEIMTYAYYAGLVTREEPVLFIRRFDKQSSVRLVQDTFAYIKNLVGFHSQLVKQGYLSN